MIEELHTNKSIRRVLHIASKCNKVSSDRNSLVEKLVERGLVDSYGKCQHNKDFTSVQKYPPSSAARDGLMKKYAFVTAFENSFYPGYVTEKLWDPLILGSLPIYLGSPNAKSVFPEDSFVDVNDFVSYDHLCDWIEYLAENRKSYNGYHSWRNNSIPTRVKEFWQFTNQDVNCRLCRWGAENLFNLS